MQGSTTERAGRVPAAPTAAPWALLLAALAPLLTPVRSAGLRTTAWLARITRTYWRLVVIGFAGGVVYETVTEVQPLADALSDSLRTAPSSIGIAVSIALLAGVLGTRLFVLLAAVAGHRTALLVMTLASAVVMRGAPPAISALGVTGLYLVAALSGFFGRSLPVLMHWVSGDSEDRRFKMAVAIQAGLQLGLTAAKLIDTAVVRDVRWQPGFIAQAVALLAAAALFRWLVPGRPGTATATPPRRVLYGIAQLLTVAGAVLGARASQPKRPLGQRVLALAPQPTPAMRIVLWQQAALWAFDTNVMFLLADKGLDEGALRWVVAGVALTALILPFTRRLEHKPAITRLLSIGLVAAAWPAVLVGVLSLGQAAFVAVLCTAVMGMEPGTAIWSAIGPLRARDELQDLNASQTRFDNARTAGAIGGMLIGGFALDLFGTVGLALTGCAISVIAVWDGLLRPSARHELREELAPLVRRQREHRALPVTHAALLGFSTALGRGSFPVAAPFLVAVAADIAGGSTTATKAALAIGALGFAIGLGVAFQRRGRMVGRGVIAGAYLLAAGGGLGAAFAPSVGAFALGIGLLGFGAAIPQLIQAALRERERDAGAEMAAVNTEIEVWVLPSAGALMFGTAVLGFTTSWRWAVACVSVLVAVTGIANVAWRGLPARVPARPRPTALLRIVRRPGNARRALVSAAYYGSLMAYYTQLGVLLDEHGWGPRAVLVIAGLGAVRFLAPPIMHRIGKRAEADPYAAARFAFAWSLAGGALLLAAPVLPAPLVLPLAIAFLIAEATTGGGWAATKAQSDHGFDAAATGLMLALAGAAGAFVAGLAIAPLDWGGSCLVGLLLGAFGAWLAGLHARVWSTHSLKGRGRLRVVTHVGPDGSLWLLASQGRHHKAIRLRSGEQADLVARHDRVRIARWSAKAGPVNIPEPDRVLLGTRRRYGLRRRAMRWLDADGGRVGRLVWSGDGRLTVARQPRATLGRLAGYFPKEAGAAWDSVVTEVLLTGADLEHGWILRSRVHASRGRSQYPPPAAAAPVVRTAPSRRRLATQRRKATSPPDIARRRPAGTVRRAPVRPSMPDIAAYCEYGRAGEVVVGTRPLTTRVVVGTGYEAFAEVLAELPQWFLEELGARPEELTAALRPRLDAPACGDAWQLAGFERGQRRLLVRWTVLQ